MCMMPCAAVGGGVQAIVEYGRPFMHEVISLSPGSFTGC